MPYNFAQLSYSQPRASYVGLPVNEMYQAAQKLDKDYWANKDAYDTLEIATRNLDVNKMDEAEKQRVLGNFERIKQFDVTGKNFEHLGNFVKDVTKDIATDQPLRWALENQAKLNEKEKLQNEMQAKGMQTLDFSKPYTGAVNPDGTQNRYSYRLEPKLDYTERIQKIWDAVQADAGVDDKLTPDEYNMLKQGKWTGISAAKINRMLEKVQTAYKGTPEYNQDIRKREEIDLQGANSEPNLKEDIRKIGLLKTFGKSDADYIYNRWNEYLLDQATKGKKSDFNPFAGINPTDVQPKSDQQSIWKGTPFETAKLDAENGGKDIIAGNMIGSTGRGFSTRPGTKTDTDAARAYADKIKKDSPTLANLDNGAVLYAATEARKNAGIFSTNIIHFRDEDQTKQVNALLFPEVGGKVVPNMNGRQVMIQGDPTTYTWSQALEKLGYSDKQKQAGIKATVGGVLPVSLNKPGSFAAVALDAKGNSQYISISPDKHQQDAFATSAAVFANEAKGETGRNDYTNWQDTGDGISRKKIALTKIDKRAGNWKFVTTDNVIWSKKDTEAALAAANETYASIKSDPAKAAKWKFTADGEYIESEITPEISQVFDWQSLITPR